MAIDQTDVVDLIGVDPIRGEAQLIISDHLDWNKGDKQDREHMYLLQEKVNTYLRFIESGEINTACPKAKGKKAVIRLVAKYDMNDDGKGFFKTIEEALLASGHAITFERLSPSSGVGGAYWGWAKKDGNVEEDSTSRRIRFLVENELEKIADSSDGWSSLFRHKKLGNFWRLSYPDSEKHGGGAPRLDLIDRADWS
jgi:Immunity protein 27